MTRLTDEELGELERLRRKPTVLSARIKIMQAVPSLLREVRQHRELLEWVTHLDSCHLNFSTHEECRPSICPGYTCGLSKALEG